MSVKLYTQADCPTSTFKILATAKLAGVEIELPSVDTDAQAKSPIGKLPVLETEHGVIFEANAIARYLALAGTAGTVYGATAFETAQIEQWVEYASSEIDLPAAVWTYPILGHIHNNPAATSKAKTDIRTVLDKLNAYLATRTYLVAERVTLADVAVACALYELYLLVLDPGFRKAFGNVTRWFTTIVQQPQLVDVFGPLNLATVARQPPAAPEAGAAAVAPPKQEAKPKADTADKPKVEPKPKADKPKPKPKDDDEEEEDEFKEDEPKGKNPLDQLPPSPFVMDEWKRMYSNNDTRTVAVPWFFEKYDPSGYSLWWSRYKYNNELDAMFKTANLVGGFLQRLDKLRKYGFGSLIIFGEAVPLEIEALWLVRGTDIPPELSTCDDSELYDWKKVDLNNEVEKKLIADFLAWDGDFAGRAGIWGAEPSATKFGQAKTFK